MYNTKLRFRGEGPLNPTHLEIKPILRTPVTLTPNHITVSDNLTKTTLLGIFASVHALELMSAVTVIADFATSAFVLVKHPAFSRLLIRSFWSRNSRYHPSARFRELSCFAKLQNLGGFHPNSLVFVPVSATAANLLIIVIKLCNSLIMPRSGTREPISRKKSLKVVENERQRAKTASPIRKRPAGPRRAISQS
jgi:hypothetical protein